ncbi:MAG: hypothetical protein LBV68_01210, partial [Spirochaetaceae bacterium]|nr:hypothetical protein [Spirochaetaceae bacterium]
AVKRKLWHGCKTIHAGFTLKVEVPEAVEKIYSGIPGFYLSGDPVHFAAFKGLLNGGCVPVWKLQVRGKL